MPPQVSTLPVGANEHQPTPSMTPGSSELANAAIAAANQAPPSSEGVTIPVSSGAEALDPANTQVSPAPRSTEPFGGINTSAPTEPLATAATAILTHSEGQSGQGFGAANTEAQPVATEPARVAPPTFSPVEEDETRDGYGKPVATQASPAGTPPRPPMPPTDQPIAPADSQSNLQASDATDYGKYRLAETDPATDSTTERSKPKPEIAPATDFGQVINELLKGDSEQARWNAYAIKAEILKKAADLGQDPSEVELRKMQAIDILLKQP
ncbi:hypothetical protein KBC99_00465 [Candidatus Saccharibacteria bacterium]|nr:hypothetical protein [Candidatus Saccharibacteria bacterium]